MERICSVLAASTLRPSNAATRAWMRLTSWTSASSRNRLSLRMSGRQSASDVTDGATCLTVIRSGRWSRAIAGRRMVTSARRRDRSPSPADGGRLEAHRDQVRQLLVAAAGLCAGALVEDRHPAVDGLGDPDAFARNGRRDGPAQALLHFAQADAGFARNAIRDEDRALVLQKQTRGAHDAPKVAERGQLRRCREDV